MTDAQVIREISSTPLEHQLPLVDFGDIIQVGDVVDVFLDNKLEMAKVTILAYGPESDPWMVVKRRNGGCPSFNYYGKGFRRIFKKKK